MGVSTSEVGYTSATAERETMKSIRDMWWLWEGRKKIYQSIRHNMDFEVFNVVIKGSGVLRYDTALLVRWS
jgi:hypothetical protein